MNPLGRNAETRVAAVSSPAINAFVPHYLWMEGTGKYG